MLNTNERNYIMESMKGLLDEYDYCYTTDALSEIIDEWECQKAGLIEAFKKHPNYVEGKFMIAFDTNYERAIDCRASDIFGNWINGFAIYERNGLFPEDVQAKTEHGNYVPWDIWYFFRDLRKYASRCISEETANVINEMLPNVRAHAGQKTSRVVNKICVYLGLDKVDGYNREFAKYADSLSPITIKRHTVLSINPLDYLTMSFGNSWASCHTIDKENKRNMPNNYSGCYSSGTVSYMLDPSSMVLYTVDASYNGNEYWDQPKINRQMFHYGEEKLVQGRLYPQDNDGATDEYTTYRNIVQEIISTIFNFPNLWTLKKGTEAASMFVNSRGTHYKDYYHYSNCSLSRIKGSENEEKIDIGAKPICIKCGDRHSTENNISCCSRHCCADCGDPIYDEEDIIWIDDEPYCRDCVSWCEHCDQYHRGENTYVRGYGYVCEDCLDSDDFVYCEHCNDYVRAIYATYIEREDEYICNRCRDRYYSRCESCGEWINDDEVFTIDETPLCEECYDERCAEENEVC